MDTPNDATLEELSTIVRRIALRELRTLDSVASMSDDDVKRLAVLSLVLQRCRLPADKPDGGDGAAALTHDQLMRKAAANG